VELVPFEAYIFLAGLPTTVAFTGSDVIVARHVNECVIRLISIAGVVVAKGLHKTFVSVLGSLLRGFIVHYPNS